MKAAAYKGHCVLCKDVLSFGFQTFDFQVLCFGFRVLCPVLLNGAMEIKKKGCFVFQTFEDTKHKSQNTKLESQKFETQNTKHPYTKHNYPNGDKLKEKVLNKNMTIVQVYSHRHFYRTV